MRLPPADLHHILDHTAAMWRDLADARIFITGGTGFFGKWMLASLTSARSELGVDVRACVLSRASPQPATDGIEFVTGDVRRFDYPQGEFTHIIHAATPADAALNAADPLEMFDIIVAGTRRVVEFARAAGVGPLLLCSSGAVYGRQSVERVSEEAMTGPDPLSKPNAYAEGKRAAEMLCVLGSAEPKIARGFAFMGPYLPIDTHFAAGNFVRDAMAGANIVIRGDGTPLRSYLYAADLAIWLWTILAKGVAGRAYNVGSEAAVSIAELAEITNRVVNPGGSVAVLGAPVAGRPPERYVPSTARAREELGLEQWIGLEEALRRWVDHLR